MLSAVIAESPDAQAPDLWRDLPATVGRAGGPPGLLWVDDSKAVYVGGQGRDRLDAAALAVALAVDPDADLASFARLLAALGAGTLDEVELLPWLDDGDPPFPSSESRARCDAARTARPFDEAPWRLVAVLCEVIGPARFNAALDRTGNKAKAHFEAFARLLAAAWALTEDASVVSVASDKHGGRHFYLAPLTEAFPDVWFDRGVEGPDLSQYTMRASGRRLELSFRPRADASDGLVALASIVSKAVREHWMDAFNAHWRRRVPGLRPTAGYPLDAARFRRAIEPLCRQQGLAPACWWRAK